MSENLTKEKPTQKRFPVSIGLAVVGLLLSLAASIFIIHNLLAIENLQDNVPTDTLKIATINWPGYYPFAAAIEAHYFETELPSSHWQPKLSIVPIKLQDTGEAVDYIRTGRANGAFGVLTDFVILKGLGSPINMILATDLSLTDTVLAASHIKSPQDLIGKTIGISEFNSFAEYFIVRALERHKVDPDKVLFKTIPSRAVPEAILDGEIDAGHSWGPDATRKLKAGVHALFNASEKPNDVISGLIFRKEAIKNTTLIDGFMRGYFRALNLLRTQPNTFYQLVSRFYDIPVEVVKNQIELNSLPMTLKDNIDLFQTGGTLESEIQSNLRFFHDRGLILRSNRPLDLVNLNPLLRLRSSPKDPAP